MASSKVKSQKSEVKEGKYNPSEIEKKWQRVWDENKTFAPNLSEAKNPYYNLMMFPYPSAEGLHAGNMYAFTGADIWGRYQRMLGHEVFQPIGLDGFGIHSENYAIKIGKHPKEVSQETEGRYYAQLKATGIAYDWDHILETYDIDYYRWTQWFFVQMFKKGLAYRSKQPVNWCPSCKTVLADEQVIAGECERCSSQVEKRDLEQWFFKITDYAERLLAGLDHIDWTEKVKIAQRNWIGKSVGCEIEFEIVKDKTTDYGLQTTAKNTKAVYSSQSTVSKLTCFTTRPDTLYGVTFIVIPTDSPFVDVLTTKEYKQAVSEYIKKQQAVKSEERTGEKSGVFTGSYVLNPANGKRIPVYLANYVVSGYGTEAVMGVPAHDQRDWEFANKFGIEIAPVIQAASDISIVYTEGAYSGGGILINSEGWNGLSMPEDLEKVLASVEAKGWGQKKVNYHLRDWLISRQRYWGPPIPMIFCEKCHAEGRSWFDTDEAKKNMPGPARNAAHSAAGGWYPVPETDLPVVLPYVENFKPTGTGEAPLAQDKEWMSVSCPNCGSEARRETDVSDTFLDSAWYYLRYPSVRPSENSENQKSGISEIPEHRNSELSDSQLPWDPEITRRWLPVDMYIGGAEHSVLHLMYVRFATMALFDWGMIDFEEPFPRFYAHGLLIKEGKKMSKSKGNVIVPDTYIEKYGADTLRSYLMFLGPYDQGGDFRDTGIEGMNRFLNRVWRLVQENSKLKIQNSKSGIQHTSMAMMHKTIKKVTDDLDKLHYNVAIAHTMEYYNFLSKQENVSEEEIKTLVLLIAPFAPHMAEELYQLINPKGKSQNSKFESVHTAEWPKFDPNMIVEDTVELPVQVNGKLRGTIKVNSDSASDREFVEKQARGEDFISKYLEGNVVKKVIFVPGKLLNFVV